MSGPFSSSSSSTCSSALGKTFSPTRTSTESRTELHENPYAGDLVPGTGGVRKLRAAVAGRGKRGSARVLYYYVDSRLTVYFLLAYAKNETRDLSPAGKQRLHQLVQIIKTEKE